MKRHAPATMRNREPLLERLQELFPGPDAVDLLELASGTGEHAVFFAERMPHVRWHPTDIDPAALASIEAHRGEHRLANLTTARRLDATDEDWGVEVDAILCINMIHIAPWEATIGLLRGAARHLRSGGTLVTYGPYHRDGRPTAPSNAAFDAALRAEDPRWGVRDLEAIVAAAVDAGLAPSRTIQMPANNHLLTFRRGVDSARGAS